MKNINLQEELELISRIRVVLGTINIEAKNAPEIVSIDSALGKIIETPSMKNAELAKGCECTSCEKEG
jgi:hypothetical protein